MMKVYVITASLIGVIAFAVIPSRRQNTGPDDESAYYKTASIKGQVTILNHPTLGKTPGSGTFLVFQRVDCPRATMGTWTDLKGKYEIRVGTGKYRLVIRDGWREGQTKDVLVPNQQRTVDTGPPGTITILDVQILVPRE